MKGFIRHPAHIPIEVSLAARAPGPEVTATGAGGGLWFAAGECWQVGSLLTIRIPVTRPAFEDQGLVAWCRPMNNHFEVGVTLTSAESAYRARMVEQICHIDEYRRRVNALEGRELSDEAAALEWIANFARDFPAAAD